MNGTTVLALVLVGLPIVVADGCHRDRAIDLGIMHFAADGEGEPGGDYPAVLGSIHRDDASGIATARLTVRAGASPHVVLDIGYYCATDETDMRGMTLYGPTGEVITSITSPAGTERGPVRPWWGERQPAVNAVVFIRAFVAVCGHAPAATRSPFADVPSAMEPAPAAPSATTAPRGPDIVPITTPPTATPPPKSRHRSAQRRTDDEAETEGNQPADDLQ